MIDWSATAAWITLLLTLIISVISPVITTYLNYRYQLKIRKLEIQEQENDLYYSKKVSCIETFIAALGKCAVLCNREVIRECGEAFHLIYLYTSQDLWAAIDEMQLLMSANKWDEVQKKLPSLSKALAEEINKSKPQHQQL